MKSLIAILLVTTMVVVIPVGKAQKVGDLISQFLAIFQWYLKYRSIESDSASKKADAIREALVLLEALQLHTDKKTNFLFGLIDIKAFIDEGVLESQLQTIFKAGDDPEKLKYPMPSRVFKDITAAGVNPKNLKELSIAENFLRKSYADQTHKSGRAISQEENVVLVYKLVEAADLNQQKDTSPKKQYMLCMLAVGTKA